MNTGKIQFSHGCVVKLLPLQIFCGPPSSPPPSGLGDWRERGRPDDDDDDDDDDKEGGEGRSINKGHQERVARARRDVLRQQEFLSHALEHLSETPAHIYNVQSALAERRRADEQSVSPRGPLFCQRLRELSHAMQKSRPATSFLATRRRIPSVPEAARP